VKPGDKLMRVDSFDCMGVPRAVIRSRILSPPHSEIVLEFQPHLRMFTVILLCTPGLSATHNVKAHLNVSQGARAQLLSTSVRNSVSESATSQSKHGDREQGLERRTHNGWYERSQSAERFQGSLSADKERGNGSERDRDKPKLPHRERELERERKRDRGGDAGGYRRDDTGQKDGGIRYSHMRHLHSCYGTASAQKKLDFFVVKKNLEEIFFLEAHVAEFN